MVQINFASREVNCKLVYYGPGRCGKTTNLQIVHQKAPANSKGELVSIATETDRTLFFDFLPLDLGMVAGMRTKFQLYTVPGQVYYDATRKLVLQGCDGVVFVADSNPDIMAENVESLDNLARNLKENGLDIEEIPLVLQFNKRDLPNAVPVEEINAKLNRRNWPTVEAVAINGEGVFQTLKIISQQVIKRLNREYGDESGKRGVRPASGLAKAAGAPAPPPPPQRPVAPIPPRPPPVAAPMAAAAASVAPPPPAVPRTVPPAATTVAMASAAPQVESPPPPAVVPASPAGTGSSRSRSGRAVASPPPAAAVQAAPRPPAPQDAARAPVIAPPANGGWRSRTDVFKERMAEIRKQRAQRGSKLQPVAAAGTPQGDPVQASPGTAPEPKKKGCFGKLLMAAGMLLVAGLGLIHWLK